MLASASRKANRNDSMNFLSPFSDKVAKGERDLVHCLVLGGGGREHALCDAMAHASSCGKLFALPGSQAIAESTGALCPALEEENGGRLEGSRVLAFCKRHDIGLVVVGPEQPIAEGIADLLRRNDIPTLAPGASAARIETSKAWAKDLLVQAKIPTPQAQITDSHKEAQIILARWKHFPVVVKADGLAQGKGVVVATTRRQAEKAVELAMVEKRFGKAGTTLLFEEYLEGQELSYFALCDGVEDNARFFGVARDYKRALDGDKGENTGGMGAFALAPPMGEHGSLEEWSVRDSIVLPLLRRLSKKAEPYRGILFLGLMATASGVQVLEANARLGDPEAQTLLPLLEGDLVETFLATAKGQLLQQEARHRESQKTKRTFNFTESVHSVTVVAAAKGYPAKPQTGSSLEKLDAVEEIPDLSLFHAGTTLQDKKMSSKENPSEGNPSKKNKVCFHACGGRVFSVNARGSSFEEARRLAYKTLQTIDWKEGFYRHDIAEEKHTTAFLKTCDAVLKFS